MKSGSYFLQIAIFVIIPNVWTCRLVGSFQIRIWQNLKIQISRDEINDFDHGESINTRHSRRPWLNLIARRQNLEDASQHPCGHNPKICLRASRNWWSQSQKTAEEMICMIMHCKMIKLMVNESQLIKKMTTPKSMHEYSYTRYNSRRKNKVKCPGGCHKIGHACDHGNVEMHVKCRMAVSCVPPCLSKGISPPKIRGPLLDIGEWKAKLWWQHWAHFGPAQK